MYFLLFFLQVLCKSYPSEFMSYFHYCRSLRFDDKPDYSYLKRLFRDLFIREGESCLFLITYICFWSSQLHLFWPFCPATSVCQFFYLLQVINLTMYLIGLFWSTHRLALVQEDRSAFLIICFPPCFILHYIVDHFLMVFPFLQQSAGKLALNPGPSADKAEKTPGTFWVMLWIPSNQGVKILIWLLLYGLLGFTHINYDKRSYLQYMNILVRGPHFEID